MTIERTHSQEFHLTAFWKEWCKDHDFEWMSADELLLTTSLDEDAPEMSPEEKAVVRAFIFIWEECV